MFHHCVLFFSQIHIWTIVKRIHLLPCECLQVFVRCMNPSIWYWLTHELRSTLIKHTPHVVQLVLTRQAESSLRIQIHALPKSSIMNKTLKKGDQKAYPKVTPHCPLSGSICRVGRKTVIGPTGSRRAGVITLSDPVGVVPMHDVTQDSINLPFMACALKHSVLPLAARQMCKTVSISINNHYRLRI
jgi:hypothetical protein